MIKIEAFENNAQIARVVYWAYKDSQEMGNDILNFYETVWKKDIASIVETCREHGICEFSISNTCSDLTNTLADFEDLGCKVVELIKVKSLAIYNKEKARMIPAIKLEVR